jgi:lysophospholipase L1-like esterase
MANYVWHVRPEIVVIEIGINDTVFDNNQAATIANIKTIVEFYQTKVDRVYVCSSYPFNIAMYMAGPFGGNPWATVPTLTAYNTYVNNVSTAIKTWCETEPNTTFIDLRPTSSPSGELLAAYTYDGVHGTDLMNKLIMDSVMVYENNY